MMLVSSEPHPDLLPDRPYGLAHGTLDLHEGLFRDHRLHHPRIEGELSRDIDSQIATQYLDLFSHLGVQVVLVDADQGLDPEVLRDPEDPSETVPSGYTKAHPPQPWQSSLKRRTLLVKTARAL